MEVEPSPTSPAPLIQAEHSYSLCEEPRAQSPFGPVAASDSFNDGKLYAGETSGLLAALTLCLLSTVNVVYFLVPTLASESSNSKYREGAAGLWFRRPHEISIRCWLSLVIQRLLGLEQGGSLTELTNAC